MKTSVAVGAFCLLACLQLRGVATDANKSASKEKNEAEIKNQKLSQGQDMKKTEDQCLYEAANWQDCKRNGKTESKRKHVPHTIHVCCQVKQQN